MNPLTASRAPRHRTDALFPVLAFDEDTGVFLLADNTLGFGFLCHPATTTQGVNEGLNVMLNLDWPTGSGIQFTLWASPDIEPFLAAFQNLRFGRQSGPLQDGIDQRISFLRTGTREPLEDRSGLRARDIQLLVTIKLPVGSLAPTPLELGAARDLALRVEQCLKTTGFNPRQTEAEAYLRFMSTVINWGEQASWRDLANSLYDPKALINDQVADYDTVIGIDERGLWLGDRRVTVLSVKRYPDQVYLGGAIRYLGDPVSGNRGIRGNILITANIQFPDRVKSSGKIERDSQFTAHQTFGGRGSESLLKFQPSLAKKQRAFQLMREALDSGDRVVNFYLGVVLFSDSEDEARRHVSHVVTFYREAGLQIMQDRYACLPLFLNALPFGMDLAACSQLQRYRPYATRHVIPLLPLFGDWKGTGRPVVTLVSRNGQVMGVNLYDSQSNYNAIVAAASGKGKSFFANQLIRSYLEIGGRVWVIDVGESYKKLSRELDGEFMEFNHESAICLNPFTLVNRYEDEEDMLIGLLTAMAAPRGGGLTDLQIAALRRVLKATWDREGREMGVDQVATALIAEAGKRIQDIGRQLYAYTREGQYDRLFNGRNSVNLDHRFIVMELNGLKGRQDLQQVVLLQLMYQIQQVMYQQDEEIDLPKLVVIDEAWELLSQGQIGLFIENGYRRFRKRNGAAVIITQGIDDIYRSESGQAIISNSANVFLLGQKPEAIASLEKEDRLASLGPGGIRILKTLHTERGAYAEVLCITEFGIGVGRVIADPYTRLLYSSTPEDVAAIQQLRQQGLSQDEAIRHLVQARKGRGY